MQYPYPYPAAAERAPQQQYTGNGQVQDSNLTTYGTAPQQQYGDMAPPMEEEPLKVSMVVPEGAQPGMKLTYSAPDGQELRLTVPEGVPPGSVMTLTQDPQTKQWRCMAEPAEPPPPQMTTYNDAAQAAQAYEQPRREAFEQPRREAYEQPRREAYEQPPQQALPQAYSAPAPAPVAKAAPAAPERKIPAAAAQAPLISTSQVPAQCPPPQYGAATTATYPTGQAPTVISRTSYVQPMPVNLSYVPPVALTTNQMIPQMGASVAMAPGQVLFNEVTQQRALYQGAPAPATLTADPAQFNPPRQMPGLPGGEMIDPQRNHSYTPPPVPIVQSPPSYTPPPQMTIMEQRPSYTPLPQMPMQPMQPTMMATTAKVQPQQFTGPLVVGQTPSYVPPPAMMPVLQQNPSYVPPPAMPVMDGASVQLPAGFPAPSPSISALPQQPLPMGMGMPLIGAAPMGGCMAPPQPMQGSSPLGMPTAGTAVAPWPGLGGVGLLPPQPIGVGPLQQPAYSIPGLGPPAQMPGMMPYGGLAPSMASPFPQQPMEARFGPDGMPQVLGGTQTQLPQQPMMAQGFMYGQPTSAPGFS